MESELISYENVLDRQIRTIAFEAKEIESLRQERILITGAGGSIGSRIAIALSQLGGSTVLATDRDESSLHSLSLKLTSTALFEGQNFLLLDIRDLEGALEIVRNFLPTTIIHAAALKHLSVLEKQPREALLTNVYGSLNMLETSKEVGAKFVNISTDKAANPVSVLGKSKYLAELATAHFKHSYGIDFRSVRFGNVFGSRGSVIETFVDQITRKMPVTLTDPAVERFFMHPEEAAFLTLKSVFIREGDVHLFDMGEPIQISKVIAKLQTLLGGTSNVIYTGLRDGEKISEELFDGVENRVVAIPDLIYSGEHRISLLNNSPMIKALEQRDSHTLLSYLKKL